MGRRDFLIPVRVRVLFRIQLYSEEAQPGAGPGPHCGRVLAYACGEYQYVSPAKNRSHVGDSLSESVDEHIEGQLGSLIAALRRSFDFPHVTGDTRNAEQA